MKQLHLSGQWVAHDQADRRRAAGVGNFDGIRVAVAYTDRFVRLRVELDDIHLPRLTRLGVGLVEVILSFAQAIEVGEVRPAPVVLEGGQFLHRLFAEGETYPRRGCGVIVHHFHCGHGNVCPTGNDGCVDDKILHNPFVRVVGIGRVWVCLLTHFALAPIAAAVAVKVDVQKHPTAGCGRVARDTHNQRCLFAVHKAGILAVTPAVVEFVSVGGVGIGPVVQNVGGGVHIRQQIRVLLRADPIPQPGGVGVGVHRPAGLARGCAFPHAGEAAIGRHSRVGHVRHPVMVAAVRRIAKIGLHLIHLIRQAQVVFGFAQIEAVVRAATVGQPVYRRLFPARLIHRNVNCLDIAQAKAHPGGRVRLFVVDQNGSDGNVLKIAGEGGEIDDKILHNPFVGMAVRLARADVVPVAVPVAVDPDIQKGPLDFGCRVFAHPNFQFGFLAVGQRYIPVEPAVVAPVVIGVVGALCQNVVDGIAAGVHFLVRPGVSLIFQAHFVPQPDYPRVVVDRPAAFARRCAVKDRREAARHAGIGGVVYAVMVGKTVRRVAQVGVNRFGGLVVLCIDPAAGKQKGEDQNRRAQ